MPAANTRDCFTEFIGQKMVGILFGALPTSHRDIAAGTKTLIFEDGRGLTLSSNGSYWIDSAADAQRAIAITRRELAETERRLYSVLDLAGASHVE